MGILGWDLGLRLWDWASGVGLRAKDGREPGKLNASWVCVGSTGFGVLFWGLRFNVFKKPKQVKWGSAGGTVFLIL